MKKRYFVGYQGGISGPNAALIVHMDWEKCHKYFEIISTPNDNGYMNLVALIPICEGNGKEFAQAIVDALNKDL